MTTKVVVEEAMIYFEARVHLRGQRQKISVGLRNIEMIQRSKSAAALRGAIWETSFTELIPWRAAPTSSPFFLMRCLVRLQAQCGLWSQDPNLSVGHSEPCHPGVRAAAP